MADGPFTPGDAADPEECAANVDVIELLWGLFTEIFVPALCIEIQIAAATKQTTTPPASTNSGMRERGVICSRTLSFFRGDDGTYGRVVRVGTI